MVAYMRLAHAGEGHGVGAHRSLTAYACSVLNLQTSYASKSTLSMTIWTAKAMWCRASDKLGFDQLAMPVAVFMLAHNI